MDQCELVDRFATSVEQALPLEGGWSNFATPGIAGNVAYHLHFGTTFSPGEPLCDPVDTPALLRRFLEAGRDRRWHAVFAPTSLGFARMAAGEGCAAWKVGEGPVFDLQSWSHTGRDGAKLRGALNAASRLGVVTAEVPAAAVSHAEEADLVGLRRAWLAPRGGVQLGFVLGGDALRVRHGRRWFVARREGRAQALVVTQALPARNAVGIDHFLRRPGAAYGSVEAAIATALWTHRAEGVETGLLSIAPLRGVETDTRLGPTLVGREDRGHRAILSAERALRERGDRVYPAASLEHFKRKFAPTSWEPQYLVHYPGRLLPRMALAALLELLPGGPPRWLGAARTMRDQLLRQLA